VSEQFLVDFLTGSHAFGPDGEIICVADYVARVVTWAAAFSVGFANLHAG